LAPLTSSIHQRTCLPVFSRRFTSIDSVSAFFLNCRVCKLEWLSTGRFVAIIQYCDSMVYSVLF